MGKDRIQTMVNRFTINGVTYTAKPFDFGLTCDLETYGVSISEARKKGMSFMRAYFAICADLDLEDASAEIQEHLINGGTFEGLSNAIKKEMNNSDFFQAMAEQRKASEEQDTSESEAESATEKKRGRKPTAK